MIKILAQKIRNNQLNSFLVKSIIVIGALVMLDLGIGTLLNKIYFMQNHESDYMTTYVMEKNRADLLIFGASSAKHHYSPFSFKKVNLSFRNCGRDGCFIFYHYAILQSTLKRYTPKMIILDVTQDDFYKVPDSYDRISALLPYYNTHPEIHEIVEMKSPWEKIKLKSQIYPFNSKLISSITGTLDIHNRKAAESLLAGYVPLYNVWNKPLKMVPDELRMLDEKKVEFFKRFIADCEKAHIKLIIIASPNFRKFEKKQQYIHLVEEISAANHIPFWDFTNSEPFIDSPKYFADVVHLNDKGASAFSELVVEKVVAYLNQSPQNSMLQNISKKSTPAYEN